MGEESSKMSGAMKRLIIIGGAAAALGAAQYRFNIIPMHSSRESVVPLSVELGSGPSRTADTGKVAQIELPSTNPSKIPGSFMRVSMYAWTAQHGLTYANGGVKTTAGSLMEKNGVKVQLISQPDLSKSQVEQIKFADRLADGDANPADGVNFVVMMGDGSAQYLAGINKALNKLGTEYRAEVIGAIGYSGNSVSGEDSCMGPPEWQEDPTKALGGLFAGYLRDGDWNLCLYWEQQNGLKNNPDETTWDATAVNWLSTDDHIKAAESYITGYCEDRKVVKDGKLVGGPKHNSCVGGVATWTPGDVNVAKKKGGLVKLISTKENSYQMPAVVIGIHKWNQANSKKVESFLKASFEGADQVRSYDVALNRAGKAAFDVYGEESPAYWVRYYKGVVERDRTNRPVPLGGSRVANLGDNLVLFGLVEGSGDPTSSIWKATYEGFGNIAKQQYPKLVPEFPSVIEATNLTFLQALAESSGSKATPSEVDKFDTSGTISEVVAKKNWNIQFDTGKSSFSPAAKNTLEDLYNQVVVGRLNLEISGHTDNIGNPPSNLTLSKARAVAVADYLKDRAPSLFQGNRVSIDGFGDTMPLASNSTQEGRAQNRRVTITLGNR